MDVPQIFNSVEEECCYWKETAKRFYQDKIDVQLELEDYTEESKQLESELEASLEQSDKTIKDLRGKITQIQIENDNIKKKLLTYETENNKLEQELHNIKNERDQYRNYLRELEQKNDDLKRAHRIVSESAISFEQMLNQAYEKNALLEIEVDERELLQVKLQRLMDETRDLKQELSIKNRSPTRNFNDKLKIDDNNHSDIYECNKKIINNINYNNEPEIIVNPILTTSINHKIQTLTHVICDDNIDNNTVDIIPATTGPSTTQLTINNSLNHNYKRVGVDGALTLQQQQQQQQDTNNFLNNNLGASGITTNCVNIQTGPTMTPSNRATSLKLISDLLQQFNHFEATLRSCIIIPPQQIDKLTTATTTTTMTPLMDKTSKKSDDATFK